MSDPFIASYAKKDELINRITKRFSTYGFSQITTSTFEKYDLYMHLKGTVQTKEMVKTFDHTGNILTLRSDVTIPITERLLHHHPEINSEHRYFYVLDVFRHPTTAAQPKEQTQAGVECFGINGIETDADMIALAIHTLQDLKRPSIKLEIGHAGFFERCISALQLESMKRNELKLLLQTKNMSELKHFLFSLQVDTKWKNMIEMIPLLYGEPPTIIERVRRAVDDDVIHAQMDEFNQLYELLEAYNLAEHIVIDLSLMNHMDYYSDIIFQGFVHDVGKPVLMGGRYNELTAHFGRSVPAIGFACDVDAIVRSDRTERSVKQSFPDIWIKQTENTVHTSLSLATYLREHGWAVRTTKSESIHVHAPIFCTIEPSSDKQLIHLNIAGERYTYTSFDEIHMLLDKQMRKEN